MKNIPGILLLSTFAFLLSPSAFPQGSLTPPGAPAPTMKSLDQVEARIPIDAAHTPGDANNLFIINRPGAYYLTDNVIGVSGKNGILVQSYHVTIDLNGKFLGGGGAASGSLSGVTDGGAVQFNLVVRNGMITAWGGNGISFAVSLNTSLRELIVANNGGAGISGGDSAVIRDCVARDNAADNIVTFYNSQISHCVAAGSVNGSGFNLGTASEISDCTASFNKVAGITANPSCVVSRCAAVSNIGWGINAGNGCLIDTCNARLNGNDNILTFSNAHLSHCTANNSTNGNGINVGLNSAVNDCSANVNKLAGILTGPACAITKSIANQNQSHGIQAQDNLTVTDCTAITNGTGTSGFGIFAGNGSTIVHSTTNLNKSGGISASAGASVMGCTVYKNSGLTGGSGIGIVVSDGSTVSGNTVRENDGDAIRITAGCRAVDNTCDYNGRIAVGSAGILVPGGNNRIENNNVTSNLNAGFGLRVTGGGNIILRNSAKGNSTNYNIAANNRYGQVVDLTAANPATVNGNSSATSTASSDPWANFSY